MNKSLVRPDGFRPVRSVAVEPSGGVRIGRTTGAVGWGGYRVLCAQVLVSR